MNEKLAKTIAGARRRLNVDVTLAYLGDGTGEVHDRSRPGNYWVRYPQDETEPGAPVSLPAEVNANLPTTDGLTVEIGLRRGKPVILGAHHEGLISAGINPIQLNPTDIQANHLINQTQITTFYATRHADLDNKPFTAVIFPGIFYVEGVPYFFPGAEIDLTSLQPSAGEHCFASAFIKTDLSLEVFASTAVNISDPLSDVDLQEADALKTADSFPVWAWDLSGDDTALTVDEARQVDLRQAFGAGGGGASALDDLTDVTLTSAAQGDILTRKVSDWNNVNVPVESVVARITGADVAPISMGASTILARLASGSIVAATVAQIKTLLAIVKADISDFGTYRTQLTATRTYYVRTDGNDSNTGLADNAGGAFLTVQKAIDVASALDTGGYALTLQVRSGTFTGANTLKSYLGSGLITIVGDETTPANVVISVTSNNCFTADGVTGKWALRGMKLSTTTSGHCIYTANGSAIEFENLNFGACAEYHMVGYTAYVTSLGNYTISGSAARHYWATVHGAIVFEAGTATLTGTPDMSTAFAVATDMGLIRVISSGVTYSGSGTGKRYTGTRLSDIYTASGGGNFFPGDVAGTVDGTSSYV